MKSLTRLGILVSALLLAGTASAVPISASTGIATPDTVIDFDALPLGAFQGDEFDADGVAFSGLSLTVITGGGFPGIGGRWINAGGSGNPSLNTTEIQFLGTVTEAAVRLATNSGSSTITALLDGSVIESYAIFTSINIAANWVGFESITFDTLRIQPGGTNGAHHFDNVSFSGFTAADAPAPGTLALLGLGLIGAAWRRRPIG